MQYSAVWCSVVQCNGANDPRWRQCYSTYVATSRGADSPSQWAATGDGGASNYWGATSGGGAGGGGAGGTEAQEWEQLL